MGGNWGTNQEKTNTLPEEYFAYLKSLNVDWVGISVALHYDDSLDSTVERKYSGVNIPTFSDDFLRKLIRAYHQHGICIYLTLAFEAQEAEMAEHPVSRWQLGGSIPISDDGRSMVEFWPWALDHPDHDRFVAEFWESYTEQSVHFGRLAEEEGVALYSLGTETEGLFRTRPGSAWPGDFNQELRSMVAAVRAVYSGPLTYDMHFSVLTDPGFRTGPGAYVLWEDLDLDVIGISSYFPLADNPPSRVLSVEALENRWENIFQKYLIPLHNAHPDRPIYFTEFGATDSTLSPYISNADEFNPRLFVDNNGNHLDDGEETQANIYAALYNVIGRHPGVLNGTFLWGMMMAGNDEWRISFARVREFSVRNKLAEDVVRSAYGASPRSPTSTAAPTLSPEQEISFFIYADSSSPGWSFGPWQGQMDLQSEAVVHSGQHAIAADLDPWGSLGMWTAAPFDLSQYRYLEFAIHGGEQGGQTINVLAFDQETITANLAISYYTQSAGLPPGEWVVVQVPVKDLNPTHLRMTSFVIENHSDEPIRTIYVDDIRFVSAAPGNQ